ncbi:unnamed protein product [Staurois parvus]|uniref:Uncharacterized protein n=1 Tax=Staurois parvus TaxID=386267 RepID=A0ABN9FHX7_9NEOB|nr:unnamed protein product [Staurois parvus]
MRGHRKDLKHLSSTQKWQLHLSADFFTFIFRVSLNSVLCRLIIFIFPSNDGASLCS